MDIRTIKESILLCGLSNFTPWIWGMRGLGKSAIHAELAEEVGYGLIDMRCSQMEASELRGLPDKQNGRTIYYPPEDLPIGDKTYADVMKECSEQPEEIREDFLWRMQNRFKYGILFLDELNRAADDVIQAVFQLVLSRAIGRYRMPKGWFVSVAGNYAGSGNYVVNSFNDDAWNSRFCHLHFPSGLDAVGDWVGYMSRKYGDDVIADKAAREVIEFATHDIKVLEGPEVARDFGFTITPSKRSWEAIVKVKSTAASGKHINQRTGEPLQFSDEAVWAVIAGLVGYDTANTFRRWDCPVKANEIFEKGMDKVKDLLTKLSRGQLVGLTWGVIGFMKPRLKDVKFYPELFNYIKWLTGSGQDKDLALTATKILVTEAATGVEGANIFRAASGNPIIAKALKEATSKSKTWGKQNPFLEAVSADPTLNEMLNKTGNE